LQGKSVLKSLYVLFRWISLFFTILYLINDNLALHYLDNFKDLLSNPQTVWSKFKFKYIWNTIVDFILNLLGKTKIPIEDPTPEPKMLSKYENSVLITDLFDDKGKKIDFMNKNELENYLTQHNKSDTQEVKIIIQDRYGNTYNDNWGYYKKLIFILGLIISGYLVITMISDSMYEMIKFPFDHLKGHLII
jgi:hypothetical protein